MTALSPTWPQDLLGTLSIDCGNCSGLCCMALYCFQIDGFPADKPPGKACPHLQQDFRCGIHQQLAPRGLKGCMAYDCFGAGQVATQKFGAASWRQNAKAAQEASALFGQLFSIHQALWLLAHTAQLHPPCQNTLAPLAAQLLALSQLGAQALIDQDLEPLLRQVNRQLHGVYQQVSGASGPPPLHQQYLGQSFRGKKLMGRDFTGALLIATDFSGCNLTHCSLLGADLRDANLADADLRRCFFLTQMQINGAKGNAATRLPPGLNHPGSWGVPKN